MASTLLYTVQDDAVYVSGKTYDYKDTLKSLGAKWNPEQKKWYFPGETNVDTIRTSLESILAEQMEERCLLTMKNRAEEKARKLWEASPEGKKARVLEALRTDRSKYSWICCEEADVVDWKRMTCFCATHDFRVRGCIYNGT